MQQSKTVPRLSMGRAMTMSDKGRGQDGANAGPRHDRCKAKASKRFEVRPGPDKAWQAESIHWTRWDYKTRQDKTGAEQGSAVQSGQGRAGQGRAKRGQDY